jgi:hypothetical protein
MSSVAVNVVPPASEAADTKTQTQKAAQAKPAPPKLAAASVTNPERVIIDTDPGIDGVCAVVSCCEPLLSCFELLRAHDFALIYVQTHSPCFWL